MNIMDYEWVLASINPPSIWNLYPTREQAELEANDVIKRDGYSNHQIMTFDDYRKVERAFYLDGKERQISRAEFWRMLEVLPPSKWESGIGFESFLMVEHTSGPYTEQYVMRGRESDGSARYYSKTVDSTDRSTWMTREEPKG